MNNGDLEFRKIPSLKLLYEINSNGTILRNVKSKKQIKIKLDFYHSSYGYYVAFVHIGGRKPGSVCKRVMIHRAVAECWHGPCPIGYQVEHIDRNSHNNDYRNLRYVTHSEQMRNRDHSGISARGKKNLECACAERSKPVEIQSGNERIRFPSYMACARYLSEIYQKSIYIFTYRLSAKRSHIYDYDVVYLNAETGHGSSTEQGTVH